VIKTAVSFFFFVGALTEREAHSRSL
jgi:hypothetical protein